MKKWKIMKRHGFAFLLTLVLCFHGMNVTAFAVEEEESQSVGEINVEMDLADEPLEDAGEAQDLELRTFAASRATYSGKVTLYGSPAKAIKEGPINRTKVTIDLGIKTGQSWNNEIFQIPQVSEYFVLNDGWDIDYVNVAGNSAGNKKPGEEFFLSMSGGSMVYYFKQVAQVKTYTLNYDANGGIYGPGQQTLPSTKDKAVFSVSMIRPTRKGHTFKGWSESSEDTVPSYYGNDPYTIMSPNTSATLYAVWEKNHADYKVEWYDTKNHIIREPETRSGMEEETVMITEDDKVVQGYVFDENNQENIKSAILKYQGTVLKLYFIKSEVDKTSLEYMVEWRDIDGNQLREPEIRTGMQGARVSVTEDDKIVENYKFAPDYESNILEVESLENGTVLKLYFSKEVPDTPSEPSTLPEPTNPTEPDTWEEPSTPTEPVSQEPPALPTESENPSEPVREGRDNGDDDTYNRTISRGDTFVKDTTGPGVPVTELPDNEIPLAAVQGRNDFMTLSDEEIPLAGLPKTGEQRQMVWIVTTIFSSVSLFFVILFDIKKRKKKI